MIATFVLILHLQAGGLEVHVMPNFFTCIVRSQFEAKRNDVLMTMCAPSLGYDA